MDLQGVTSATKQKGCERRGVKTSLVCEYGRLLARQPIPAL